MLYVKVAAKCVQTGRHSLACAVVSQQQVTPGQRDPASIVTLHIHANTEHSRDHELRPSRMY